MQKAFCNDILCRAITKTKLFRLWMPARKKTLLVMRFIAMFLFIACMQAGAKGFTQTVSLSVKNAKLEKVFDLIKAQTGYTFIYTQDMLRKSKPVTLTFRDIPLETALQLCFNNQPLSFTILNKMIVVKEKPVDPSPTDIGEDLFPPPIDIRGRIVNEKGEPVMATVQVKGGSQLAGTDENGYFQLDAVDPQAVLVITGVSIERREYAVSGKTDLLHIVVKIKSTAMDELQVIAYGVTSKRFLVGAVTTIKSEQIQQQPVNNVFLALQGRVPGLIVNSGSGAPGSGIRMQIRGQNTLPTNANMFANFDQPLIIIDGVPFSAQNRNINLISSFGSGNGGGIGGFGALTNINPNDVESITVLRDADATSIYGSQGANGVILITTKKGVPGKTTFGVRVSTGPNRITRRQEYLKTQEYLELRREAISNDGLTLPPVYDGTYPDLQLFDTTKYTDWFKEFFGGTSNNTDVQATLSGGTENTSFILSAGYSVSKYNFPGDFAEKRLSLHSGFQYRSKNNKLNIDFITDFSYSHNNNASSPTAAEVNALPPNTPDLLDENGNLVWSYKGMDFGYTIIGGNNGGNVGIQYQHYAYLKQPYDLKKYYLNNSLQVSYKILPGLDVTINTGYSRFNSNEHAAFPIASQSPFSPYAREGSASFAKNEFETINIEPQLNYQRNIGKGVFTVLAGATYKQNLNDNMRIDAGGYTNDGFLNSVTGARAIYEARSNNIIYKYVGVYGRAGYIYDSKYILNITGRRDGSSNFGPGQKFGTFASVGSGWIISEENFFRNLKPTFSLLKLSANYGSNGSDGVEPYNYQEYWTNIAPFGASFLGLTPYTPLNLYNPDYSWATKRTLNIMLDLGFFNDRLMVNANWYDGRTSNQLVGVILPSQTGFSSVTDNLGATVQNTGFEIALTSANIRTAAFTWNTNFNFSVNRNKLIAFPDLEKSSYGYQYIIGQSLNILQLVKFKGVNPQTGVFDFYDAKGNVISKPNMELEKDGGDRVMSYDMQPGFTGGIENSFSYKGFSLSVFFQFAKQLGYNHLFAVYTRPYQPGGHGNLPILVRDRWKKPGDIATFQRATTGASVEAADALNSFFYSDGSISNASYVRLKTLALTYDFPERLVKKAGMQGLKVYASAQNLLTITGYKFGDPEQPGDVNFPLQRTVVVGLSFNF